MTVSGRAIARAGLIVTAAYLGSRVLGYVRTVVISSQFGAGPELDAYFAAFRIPDAMFQLVAAGAVGSALIPVLTELLVAGEEARAWRVVSTIANLMLLALLVLGGALFVLAPAVMPAITPGFDQGQLDLTVRLTRIMLLSPIMLALGAVATSALFALGRFAVAAVAPLLYNLGIIGGAVLLAPSIGVEGLAIGVVAGAAASLAIQAAALVRGRFDYRPRLELADQAARTAFVLMVPRAFGLAAVQIIFLVNNALASGLGEGAVSVYNVAFTMLQLPIGVIGVPLGIVLLPAMSQALASGARARFADLAVRSLRLVAFVTVPITGLVMVVARPAVAVLFLQGRFDAQATALTADTLIVFVVALASHTMVAILAPAFYAGKDTRTPVAAAVVGVSVDVVAAVVLVGPFGLQGLAAAITLSTLVEVAILLALLERRFPEIRLAALARSLAILVPGTVAASLAALAALAWLDGPGPLEASKVELGVQLVVAATAAGLVFLAYAVALRLEELRTLGLVLGEVVRRRGTPA